MPQFNYYRVITFLLSLICLALIAFYYFSNEIDTGLVKFYYVGGILSGIFAFGAFIMVLITYNRQGKDSKKQEIYYKRQLKIAEKNIHQQKQINDFIRFETTFFNMLNLQQQIVHELSYNSEKNQLIVKGREMFAYLFMDNKDGIREGIKKWDDVLYNLDYTYTEFDHYFRHLYNIIKFVHETEFLDYDQKYKYTSIVRATLSRHELIWLYYNCLFERGNEKFKDLIEQYCLLKNIRRKMLALSDQNSIQLKRLGLTRTHILNDTPYSGSDFEFYLTTEKNDKKKYHISAFYPKNKLDEGEKLIVKWNIFLDSKKNTPQI